MLVSELIDLLKAEDQSAEVEWSDDDGECEITGVAAEDGIVFIEGGEPEEDEEEVAV